MNLYDWFNTGKNQRVPNEDHATWSDLIKDDLSQLTHSDSAFHIKHTTILTWRPFKAFSPKMVKTGPTPLIRQIIKRGFLFFIIIISLSLIGIMGDADIPAHECKGPPNSCLKL
jgi:hypothetical protein